MSKINMYTQLARLKLLMLGRTSVKMLDPTVILLFAAYLEIYFTYS